MFSKYFFHQELSDKYTSDICLIISDQKFYIIEESYPINDSFKYNFSLMVLDMNNQKESQKFLQDFCQNMIQNGKTFEYPEDESDYITQRIIEGLIELEFVEKENKEIKKNQDQMISYHWSDCQYLIQNLNQINRGDYFQEYDQSLRTSLLFSWGRHSSQVRILYC